MPRHYHSSAAKCPYYRGENGVMIFCAGLYGADTLRIFFRDGQKCRIHKAKYCRREWEHCCLAQMLTKEQEEG